MKDETKDKLQEWGYKYHGPDKSLCKKHGKTVELSRGGT